MLNFLFLTFRNLVLMPALLAVLFVPAVSAQGIVWQETFDGYANGTTFSPTPTVGTGGWRAYQTAPAAPACPNGSALKGAASSFFGTDNGTLLARDVATSKNGAPGAPLNTDYVVFETDWIDISAFAAGVRAFVEISSSFTETGTGDFEDEDFVRLVYYTDNDCLSRTVFELNGETTNNFGLIPSSSSCGPAVMANSIKLRIEIANTSPNEFYRFNSINIIDAGVPSVNPAGAITHIANTGTGDWNVAATWDVATVPTGTSIVEIPCGAIVRLSTDQQVRAVVIRPGGTLLWATNDRTLEFTNGDNKELIINLGGQLGKELFTAGGAPANVTNSRILLDNGTTPFPITNNSNLASIDIFEYEGGVKTSTLNGTGYFRMGEILFSDENQVFNNNSNLETALVTRDIGGAPTLNNGDGANLYLTGETSFNNANLNTSANNNTVYYSRPNDQDIIKPSNATGYHNVVFTGSGTKTTNTAQFGEADTEELIVRNNLTITGASALNIQAGNDNIVLGGNWLNNSTNATPYAGNNRTVTLNGAANQAVERTGNTETFHQVVVNKAGGSVNLNSPVNITNNLTFTQGIVNSTATNLLTFLNNATASDAKNTSHVNGPVSKTGNQAFVFPTGNGNYYGGIGISAPNNAADRFLAQYFQSAYPQLGIDPGSAPMSYVSVLEHWSLAQTNNGGGADNLTVSLHWSDNNVSDIQQPSPDLVVAHYNDPAGWENLGNGGVGGTLAAGNINANQTQAFSVGAGTQFFTFGSIGGNNALPVTWLSFSAVAKGSTAVLNWATASEYGNDFFTVERSRDGQVFEGFSKVLAVGNSAQVNRYAFTDVNPWQGRSYYRIAQTDLDGTVTYSKVESIHMDPQAVLNVVQAYPNPVAEGSFTVLLPVTEAQATLVVSDMLGREVYRAIAAEGHHGQYHVTGLRLPQGTYLLSVATAFDRQSVKLVFR